MPYPLSNVVLDALPTGANWKLLAQMKRVPLPVNTSLYEPRDSPKYVHFITSGLASIVISMSTGETTEVGTVGREGVPQAMHFLGQLPAPTRCFMQISGTGLRMDFGVFERIFNSDSDIRQGLLAYSQYQGLLLSQIAGCNRLHDVNSRLARWLLMVQDRTAGDRLKLTQEFLAQMIGSQRTTVSAVARVLQAWGLIVYSRGNLTVLDRKGLENAACECYRTTRSLLAGLYSRAQQELFDEVGKENARINTERSVPSSSALLAEVLSKPRGLQK